MADGPGAQPTLETERLILRPFVADDGPVVERLAGDRAIADTTLNIPHPYPEGAGAEWIATHAGIWSSGGGVVFAITERRGGDVVGGIGLAVAPAVSRGELGYWIGVPYWGRGYCTEAARAVLDFAFRTLGLHRVQAHHLVRNPASGQVMQKLGMTREGLHRGATMKWGKHEDLVSYARLASD